VHEFQYNNQLLTETDRMSLWISPVAKTTLKNSVIGFPGSINFRIPKEGFEIGY
jgi:hypothetical protein